MRYEIEVVLEQGPRRAMEDSNVVNKRDGRLFVGVFDGHSVQDGNGHEVAKLLAEQSPDEYFRRLASTGSPTKAFQETFEVFGKALEGRVPGSTALMLSLKGRSLIFAHAGDSRLIVVTVDGAIPLTEDHTVDRADELERVQASGANTDQGCIIVPITGDEKVFVRNSRSFGDCLFREHGVIHTAETGWRNLGRQDLWLIAATDGLYTHVGNQSIGTMIRFCQSARQAGEVLVNRVFSQEQGKDNLTAVIIRLIW
ncbi:MAG: PP2C family protein-serine/threonine phosphatase [bacterium]